MGFVRALLISTYDLGRQPTGLAGPAARLRSAGVEVECVDASRDRLVDDQIAQADLVAFYLPMHTATRLAGPLIDRARAANPRARLAAYGLYAPLNAEWLRERGVHDVLAPEEDMRLVDLATSRPRSLDDEPSAAGRRLPVIAPDRAGLPPLSRYAALQMPDGSRRIVGTTDATRGCKHLCRHCPIVPVYRGRFFAVPLDVVMADVQAQVAAGAAHITFGDPDFFNGPTHARRLVERLARECPGVTYDVTIKIEHLLRHADLLPLLRDTGCLFVTSAVESVDDRVLDTLRKGHTRADFEDAVARCREASLPLSPTFVPFTPWTSVEGYVDLLATIAALDLVDDVAPIQLAIRLLVTAQSALLDLPEIRDGVGAYDPASLSFPWTHADPRVDALQRDVMQIVASPDRGSRREIFAAIAARAGASSLARAADGHREPPPYLTEAWYCCAEPGPEQFDLV
jgi:radical SAM superfamily enzyme YgiQ (UPF0313 family)